MQEPKPLELSIEQKFNLRSFETQVEKMSREQAQSQLLKLYEQSMLAGNLYQQMLRDKMGIAPLPTIGAYPGEGDRP